MKRVIPIPILSSRSSTFFLILAFIMLVLVWSGFSIGQNSYGQASFQLLGLNLDLPLWAVKLLAALLWIVAGLRLKSFLDRPSLTFERNRYTLLPFLLWVLPSMLFEQSLHIAMLSWLGAEVFLQANRVESLNEGYYGSFVGGLLCGLGLLASPFAALLMLIYFTVLLYLALLSWRTVIWAILGMFLPFLFVSGWIYTLSGDWVDWPMIEYEGGERDTESWDLTWPSLLWIFSGTALLLFGLFETNVSSTTANAKQRKLNQAATRSFLVMVLVFTLFNNFGDERGLTSLALFSVPSSILFAISLGSYPNWVRALYWLWCLSALLMVILAI